MINGKKASFITLLTLLTASSALADITYTVSGSDSDGAVKGTAVFSLCKNGTELCVTLTDTSSTIHAAGQVLTGLNFTLTGGSGLTLIAVTPQTYEDCSSGTCSAISEAQYVSDGGTTAPLHGWVQSGSYTIQANQLHPNGIVDPSVVNGNSSIKGNHNPYLGGPVTFEFSFTTAPTAVTAATFWWGTGPAKIAGSSTPGDPTLLTPTVPEPTSILLFGTVFLGLATVLQRKRAATR